MRADRSAGHTLLEAVVATGIFVMVAIALSGVWVMYGKALAKSAENLAANHLARSITEGLAANGWEWLETNLTPTSASAPLTEEFTMVRNVRGRTANIVYHVSYYGFFGSPVPGVFPEAVCNMRVTVEWNSNTGDKDDGDYNNRISYVTRLYKGAIY